MISNNAVYIDISPLLLFLIIAVSYCAVRLFGKILPKRSESEEADCIAWLGKDKSARDSLIVHNLRLVVYIARKYESSGTGIENLISIGSIDLIKAFETSKPERNIKLATYASALYRKRDTHVSSQNQQSALGNIHRRAA